MFTQISNHYLVVLLEESRGGKRVLAFRGIRHLQPPVIWLSLSWTNNVKYSPQHLWHCLSQSNLRTKTLQVGELRWQPPRFSPKWEGIKDAKTNGHVCPQVYICLPKIMTKAWNLFPTWTIDLIETNIFLLPSTLLPSQIFGSEMRIASGNNVFEFFITWKIVFAANKRCLYEQYWCYCSWPLFVSDVLLVLSGWTCSRETSLLQSVVQLSFGFTEAAFQGSKLFWRWPFFYDSMTCVLPAKNP